MPTLRRLKDDLGEKAKDLLARWRALPKVTQWQIAGGLLTLAAVSSTLAAWITFGRRGAANTVDDDAAVTLYTSVDMVIARPIIAEFETTTGINVRVVGDTEATKTTGLIARLLEERESPRADVWWSSEPMGTVALAKAGILESFPTKAEVDFPSGWPARLRAPDKTWYGFAQRSRVIAYNTNRLTKKSVPTRLRDLTLSPWHGKVGMARPQFGTTRTHIAALIAECGEAPVREWLVALQNNGLRLYDGNSLVVQALSVGEIEVGLTDTDDVYSAQRNNWPVDFVFETIDKPDAKFEGLRSIGPVVLPNTVARIRGGPHPNEAARLADFLLSSTTERLLALSDSRNIPIRPALAKELDRPAVPAAAEIDPAAITAAMPAADKMINDLFRLE